MDEPGVPRLLWRPGTLKRALEFDLAGLMAGSGGEILDAGWRGRMGVLLVTWSTCNHPDPCPGKVEAVLIQHSEPRCSLNSLETMVVCV